MEGSTGAGRRLPPTSGGPGARDGPSILRTRAHYVRQAVAPRPRAGVKPGGRARPGSVAAGTGGLGYENARLRSPLPTGRCRGREAPRSRRCRALAGARRPAQAGDDRSGVPRHAADSGKVQLDQNGAVPRPHRDRCHAARERPAQAGRRLVSPPPGSRLDAERVIAIPLTVDSLRRRSLTTFAQLS